MAAALLTEQDSLQRVYGPGRLYTLDTRIIIANSSTKNAGGLYVEVVGIFNWNNSLELNEQDAYQFLLAGFGGYAPVHEIKDLIGKPVTAYYNQLEEKVVGIQGKGPEFPP